MKSKMSESGVLQVFLEGRIDSANSGTFETDVNALLEKTGATHAAFDCANLEYVMKGKAV